MVDVPDSYKRAPISSATRTLLLDFAAGDMERPLHHVDADWEEVSHAVCRNGLVGMTYHCLAHWDSPDYPSPQFRDRIQKAHRTRAIRMALMYRAIGQVLSRLTESGLDYMVLKGPVLAHSVYPNPTLRAFNDLDLMVRERDWAAMHEALMGMGFESKDEPLLSQPPPKFAPQVVLYEQKYQHRGMRLLVEVHYDDLLNAGLAAHDVGGFWQRAVRMDLEGTPIKTLSLGDLLIHLCAHTHYHGYPRLIWFSDLAYLVRDHGHRVNWPQVIETVRREEAHVPVYYTLLFLSALLDVPVPGEVLDQIRPDWFRRWAHERYLPTDKVLSWQPMGWPDFSFYPLTLLRRLIPDFLVMGRRRDKIFPLLRWAVVPPGDWLRYYYGLSDGSNLAVHYLLHPPKVMRRYLIEITTALAKLGRRSARTQEAAGRRTERHHP